MSAVLHVRERSCNCGRKPIVVGRTRVLCGPRGARGPQVGHSGSPGKDGTARGHCVSEVGAELGSVGSLLVSSMRGNRVSDWDDDEDAGACTLPPVLGPGLLDSGLPVGACRSSSDGIADFCPSQSETILTLFFFFQTNF